MVTLQAIADIPKKRGWTDQHTPKSQKRLFGGSVITIFYRLWRPVIDAAGK